MATHIVAWNYKPEITQEQIEELNRKRDAEFQKLIGVVPGLLKVTFVTDVLTGSNKDLLLITEHEKAEDIEVYAVHPAHQALADTLVRPFVTDRICINFA